MRTPSKTTIRILTAFLKLAAERGIEATTTRALAEEAGVNEVTIFRLFNDKETLIREAYQHFAPGRLIAAYPLALDVSTPTRAAAGLVECLIFLRDCLRAYPQLLLIGMGEYWRFPSLHDELTFHSSAAHHLIEQALAQAALVLRPDVDRETAALSLLGLLFVTISWYHHGWLPMTDDEWNRKLEAAIHLLIET